MDDSIFGRISKRVYHSHSSKSSLNSAPIIMEDQLRNTLLAHALQSYDIGYLLLDADLVIQAANFQVRRWLDLPDGDWNGCVITDAIPELIGSESVIQSLQETDTPYQLEGVFRPSEDGLGNYFDLQVCRLGGEDKPVWLLTTTDVTRKARQEALLQQQRNEVQLLSAELAATNERMSYILNRLVPPAVARRMMEQQKMPAPGGELLREATILFADMRDFTTYAEVYKPADTLEFLNLYLAVVSESILRHDGSLVQLVGDMVMGVFNIPEEQPDHAMRAIQAAVDIQKSLRAFNETADTRFPSVAFGIGISTGPVIAGYLGVQQRFRFAVVGDATNVAFHLSSLAAAGRILIGEATVQAAGEAIEVREKGDFQLKRRRKLVKVYELNAIKDEVRSVNQKAS